MIKCSKEPLFDFNPIEKESKIVDKYVLIEKIRNLQTCIVKELQNGIIDKKYIEECSLEIEETLEEIYDIVN